MSSQKRLLSILLKNTILQVNSKSVGKNKKKNLMKKRHFYANPSSRQQNHFNFLGVTQKLITLGTLNVCYNKNYFYTIFLVFSISVDKKYFIESKSFKM